VEANDLQLAISYAELAQSLAFQDFIKSQFDECETLELEALTTDPKDFEACRSAIIAWQQRRIVVRMLQEKVMAAATNMRAEELENNDARSDPSRTDRSGW
jgi:hypothetical protein